ncbi:MAG: organic solvent tolerance protein OstA [Prolixibacteraceae bacterium]|nr:organic solvent tolerance protein OstA [Prolixibacteraceae bacterium]
MISIDKKIICFIFLIAPLFVHAQIIKTIQKSDTTSKVSIQPKDSVQTISNGQPKTTEQRKRVKITHADSLIHNKSFANNIQRLIGNVRLRHEQIVIFCDSAYSYADTNMVDGYSHVHIIKSDTLHLFADFINYNGDLNIAKAKGHVKLINKKTTLTSDSLNYDMNAGIGYYNNYGTIKDSTSTLHSKIGEYHVNNDKAFFKTNVHGTANGYTLKSDTLIYQPKSGIVSIVGPTNIFNEENNLVASEGTYNTKTGKADLFKRPVITRENNKIIANTIYYEKATGNGKAFGNAELYDLKNHIIVKGNHVDYNDSLQTAMATDSAQLIYYSERDTFFLHADTLSSCPDDSIPEQKILKAYYHVKFFRKDLQGKCDSMVYLTRDSTTQMFHEPVIWSQSNQLSADFIKIETDDKDNKTAYLNDNAFIIARQDTGLYNQIKGRKMIGHIYQNSLYKIYVDGNGESLYYATDDNGIFGLNNVKCSSIMIYLKNSKINKINLISSPEGTLTPIGELSETDKTLSHFIWMDDIRPKSQYDIFK